MQTFYRRTQASKLFSDRLRLVFSLTAKHRRRRLKKRQVWETKWHNVIFSPELLFCLDMHDGRQRIKRRLEERR